MSNQVAATPPESTRLDGVDVLRGLAILTVLLNHVNMRLFLAKIPYTRGLPDQLASTLFWSGQMGVQVFFAVSGFLITSTSIRRWGSLARLRAPAFYRLRFARIAPLLIAVLMVLIALHAAGLKHFVVPEQKGGLARAVLAALTFNINWLEATRGYLPANWDILWSLSVEEMFYLFFPLTCLVLGRGKGMVIGLAAGGLDMTIVAIGTCLVITASAQSQWAAPRALWPLTRLGQRSYEVYLTHMFVVFALFGLLRSAVVLLFISTVLLAALLGEAVARLYSEPLNSRLRNRGHVKF